jgi:hypothetical protein
MQDYDNFDKMRADHPPRRETKRRRPTVHVTNGAARPLLLHLHQVVDDDGAGRAFLGRLPDAVELRAGGNAGIDKQFMEHWLAQNKHFAAQMNITAVDEDDPVDQDFIDDAEAGAAAANQE